MTEEELTEIAIEAVEVVDAAEAENVLDSAGVGRRVVEGGLIRTVAYVGTSLASAAVLPFLFRHLGVINAGRYVTVLSLVTVLSGLVETGLSGISVRAYANHVGTQEGRTLMQDLIGMRLGMMGFATVLVLGFVLVSGYPSAIFAGTLVASAGVLFENIGSTYAVWLTTSLRQGWLAVTQIARQLTAVILMAVLIATGARLFTFFLVFAVSGLAQLAVAYLLTRDHIPHLPSLRVRSWWRLFGKSLLYVLAMALGVIYLRVAVVLVSLLGSGQQAGYFGAAFRILDTLSTLAFFVLTSALPVLTRSARTNVARYRSGLQRVVQVAMVIGMWLSIIVFVGAHFIIAVIAGPAFGPAVVMLKVLAVVMFLNFLTTAWSFGLLALERYRVVLLANATATAVAIGVAALTVPKIGGIGGAYAAVSAQATLAVGYGLAITRSRPPVRLPARAIAMVILAAAAGVGLVQWWDAGAIIRMMVATVVYALIVLGAGVLPRDVLGAVRLPMTARWPVTRMRLERHE